MVREKAFKLHGSARQAESRHRYLGGKYQQRNSTCGAGLVFSFGLKWSLA